MQINTRYVLAVFLSNQSQKLGRSLLVVMNSAKRATILLLLLMLCVARLVQTL